MEQSQTATASATLPTLVESFESTITKEMRYRAEDLCRLAFLLSDSFAILGALLAAYYIRFDLLRRILPPAFILAPSGGNLGSYVPSILLGAAILFLILFGTGAYDSRVLLRFRRSFFLLLKSVLIWFIAYAGISFILEFDADLSRVYIIIASGLLVAFLGYSRILMQRVAAKYLAKPDARTLGVIGCGWQAEGQVACIREAVPGIERVVVYCRNEKNLKAPTSRVRVSSTTSSSSAPASSAATRSSSRSSSRAT